MFIKLFQLIKISIIPYFGPRENDEESATPVEDSDHIRYRKHVSDFRTTLICLVIRSIHAVWFLIYGQA